MCELATLSAVAGLAGTAMSAVGAVQQGQAQARQARYQAAIAANNQRLAEVYAEDAHARGAEEADIQAVRARQLAGLQTAAMAAGGIDVQSGTALGAIGDTVEQSEIDRRTIIDNAGREAWRYQMDGANAGAQAAAYRSAASGAAAGGFLSGTGSLLTGLGGIGERWHAYRRESANTGVSRNSPFGLT